MHVIVSFFLVTTPVLYWVSKYERFEFIFLICVFQSLLPIVCVCVCKNEYNLAKCGWIDIATCNASVSGSLYFWNLYVNSDGDI